MADFLTRLASRTLGLAPVAEPVIAPMFAPDPSLPAMADSDEDLGASPATEPAVTRSASPPVSASDDMLRPIAPRPRTVGIEGVLETPSVRETTARAATSASDDAIVGEPSTRRHPQLSPATTRETADEDVLLMPKTRGPEQRSPGETSPPVETPLTSAPPPVRPDSPDPSRSPIAWPEESIAAPGRSAVRQGRVAQDVEPDGLLLPFHPAVTSLAQPVAAARATVTPVDEPEPPRRAEREQAAAAATPPSTPTIEITIGRVEVRAVHPPAPVARPKPVAPAAPRLSLEEYLRNQNGGRR